MKLTKEQFILINVALQTTGKINMNGQIEGRNFPLAEQKDAMNIFEKISKNVDEKEIFIDGEVDFTTTEKALLLKLLERDWDVRAIKTVFEIKTALA